MADADLEEIRRARLEQLRQQQQQQGGGGGGGGSAAGEGGDQEEKQREREAEARQNMLSQILHPAAADRLGRIRLVKESRATDVENRLIMLARSGQLRQKVTEDQLKEMLSAVAEQEEERKERIVVNRRKGGWDDDDDDDLLDL